MKNNPLTEAYQRVLEAEAPVPTTPISQPDNNQAYFTLPGLIRALQGVNTNSSMNELASSLAQHIGVKSAQRFIEFLKTEHQHR